jgi:ribosomal protein L29
LRARELRELSDEELERRLAESRENLFNLRFQMATRAHPDYPGRAREHAGEKVDGKSEKEPRRRTDN